MTVRQAATRLGVAERTILRWIENGDLQGAERLEPERDKSDYIIPLAEVERLEKKRDP